MASRNCWLAIALMLAAIGVYAQPAESLSSPTASDATFRLGAGDVLQITVVDAEEVSKGPVRIGSDGYINLPTIGRLKAADRTLEELQSAIAERLKRVIIAPDVSVSVIETHSQPVKVVGAVKTPGIVQLQGHKTLLEV